MGRARALLMLRTLPVGQVPGSELSRVMLAFEAQQVSLCPPPGPWHGRPAPSLPAILPQQSLGGHYPRCCIQNMASKRDWTGAQRRQDGWGVGVQGQSSALASLHLCCRVLAEHLRLRRGEPTRTPGRRFRLETGGRGGGGRAAPAPRLHRASASVWCPGKWPARGHFCSRGLSAKSSP